MLLGGPGWGREPGRGAGIYRLWSLGALSCWDGPGFSCPTLRMGVVWSGDGSGGGGGDRDGDGGGGGDDVGGDGDGGGGGGCLALVMKEVDGGS